MHSGARPLRPPRPLIPPALVEKATAANVAALSARRQRVPVMIVCSARAHVGRTLVARLLTEYFLANGRPVAAFDANPNDRALSDYLPFHSITAEVADTRRQMALFDRLVANDGVAKVVDLAPALTDPFFDLVERLDFIAAARANGIDIITLFMTELHSRSVELGWMLLRRFVGMHLIPVHNEAFAAPDFPRPPTGADIRLPELPTLLQGVINRRNFSFSAYLSDPANAQTPLAAWIRRNFLAIRALEIRLHLAELNRSFDTPAAD